MIEYAEQLRHQLREAHGPLYLKIAAVIRNWIVKGKWKPNERIPALATLADALGVALVTVHKAVALLEDEGLLKRAQGKGTFVSDNPKLGRWLVLRSDWSSLIHHLEDKEPQLLTMIDTIGDPDLKAEEGSRTSVYRYMRRVHSWDGVPYAVADIYLDRRCYLMAPEEFDRKMVIHVLETLPGVYIKSVRQTFSFSTADAEIASLLAVSVNAPIGDVRRVLLDQSGCAIYVGEAKYRGDFVKLEVNFDR